jgi:hypothetical protein
MNTLESSRKTKGNLNIYRNGTLLVKNLEIDQVKMLALAFKNFTSDYVQEEGKTQKTPLKNYL